MKNRTSLSWLACVALWCHAGACDPVRSHNAPGESNRGGTGGTVDSSAGGRSAGGSSSSSTGGSGGGPTSANDEWETCGLARFYCETEDCVGVEECRGVGSTRIRRCRCVAQLPSASGSAGMPGAAGAAGAAGAGSELPPTPDPYPGPGCPVDPSLVGVCGDGCAVATPCSYGAFALCCGSARLEDCGAPWIRCGCDERAPDAAEACHP